MYKIPESGMAAANTKYGNSNRMHAFRSHVIRSDDRCGKTLLLMAGALLAINQVNGATISARSPAFADVQTAITLAKDGDIVTVPAGTASWTSLLTITKGITLQGATNIAGLASSPTITDATIIQDNTPRSSSTPGLIKAVMSASQSFRLTGFTFVAGSGTTYSVGNGAIHVVSQDSAPCKSIRIDHCHFNRLYQSKSIWISGWIYGVADHNVIQCLGAALSFLIWQETWGGKTQINGNGSWADYPWFGSERSFFIEDNYIEGAGSSSTSGNLDATNGGHYVARYNYFKNAQPNTHGSEGGPERGTRCHEVYNNTINWTINNGGYLQRSGTSLFHDNKYVGVKSGNGNHSGLSNYREVGAGGTHGGTFLNADGSSSWDENDTEGDGTFVEGHPPYIYFSGTAAANSTVSGVTLTVQVSGNPGWTNNKWVGYSLRALNTSVDKCGFITSNTSNTISCNYYSSGDRGPTMAFAAGDPFRITRIITQMDQNGRGKSDQVINTSPINQRTGTVSWVRSAAEPCYSWNNIQTANNYALGYGSSFPTAKLNIDYYNLGSGFVANSTPSAVSGTYTSTRNGVAYTGPYKYPHPLTGPAPPTNLQVASQP